VSISRIKFGSTGTTVVVVVVGTVVVTDGTVVVTSGTVVVTSGTVVVTSGTVVVTDGTVVVTAELSQEVKDGCVDAAPMPKRSNGTTATTDNRPAEALTQRATMTPRTNRKTAATATPVAPPVTGNKHTSAANMISPDQSQT
jgi:hypothetical protein